MTTTTVIDPAAAADPAEAYSRESLAGLGREALADRLAQAGVPERQVRMRASQLWSWLDVRGATSFDVMTDVA